MEVDCGGFTFAVFSLFLFGTKRQREDGGRGAGSESPAGRLGVHTKNQNGSVDEKAIANARLGHEAAGVAGVDTQPAFLQRALVFCGPMCPTQKLPIPTPLPTRRRRRHRGQNGECQAFHLAGPLTGRPERTGNEPMFAQAGTSRASSASFISSFYSPSIRPPPTPKPRYRRLLRASFV